ncbi:DISARM system helicase DrmA [Marinitenerispora sediminis]|uniref:Helicase C-terminal domain-containing protein n=1 Tax=Marinitenerispora sediminis TaxID=1931232 RepID=A0A368TBN5_9ACTN|nr:DISARM system helicase DrmA [Marinitenerispora sediminis]RCV58157.1 hypothetical protein DEF28_00355 [Marinitenerispora sediminis]RCV61448.1 hypothetical protein DEF23_02170 [Marinitenerispora sediminis]RCV62528.1 hypothetical protein DEF24_00705 [Marinitenerispora sediminis]
MGEGRVLQPPSERAVRAELEELVIADLYGPIGGDEHEEFSGERPTDRYILGRLAPNGAVVRPDDQDSYAESGVDHLSNPGVDPDPADTEPEAPAVPSLSCSAHGFTAYVAKGTERLRVRASWARYVEAKPDDGSGRARVRRREPRSGETVIELREGEIRPRYLDPDPDIRKHVAVRGRVRALDDHLLVTLFLVNAQRGEEREWRKWIFQAELEATAIDGQAPVFVPRPHNFSGGDELDQIEQSRLAMNYRLTREFAVGHSTAVDVTTADGDPTRAVRVRTAAVPRYELPATDVPSAKDDPDLPELADLTLDMRVLADLPATQVRSRLGPLVTGYRAWIDRERGRRSAPDLVEFRDEADRNLAEATHAADRIAAAVDLLVEDAAALRAFRFANEAMYRQRVQSLVATKRDGTGDRAVADLVADLDRPKNRSWRPFQLAFLLLNLPALTDPAHSERSPTGAELPVADLLWFPTGGGKTEAYLGLTAYTFAIRRLQGEVSGLSGHSGVAVLMRYTLRLLTIQQFQRAAALVCACEVIRRADEQTWGRVPFRIGLWVGSRVTPNRTDEAERWVKAKRNPESGSVNRADGSPHQLVKCPWCGAKIAAERDIEVDAVARRTRIICPDLECAFTTFSSGGEGLPVIVVDEEIYRLVPSLVIGTVDKFAQLTWMGETRALFGRVDRVCERHGYLTGELQARACDGASQHKAVGAHSSARVRQAAELRPPDLIIQDELHLISGPLGSLVGLYETAVDRLAAWELHATQDGATPVRVRPKIIASTATVRRASRQIMQLYARDTKIFPPSGLDAGDSFFARQRRPEKQFGRRYVGICAHGVRVKSAQIRLYVAILAAAQKLHEKYGASPVTDPYMTLVGYFTNLRDLGGMRRLVEDDVTARLRLADRRGLARRPDPVLQELTSRLSSDEIPEVLERLAVDFVGDPNDGNRAARRRARASGTDRKWPLDVLLATNMIAVGVDVSRLGVMAVSNQPKSAAEYIQATSRVGRDSPGLVFTLYNWARPRDLSHYERFTDFHATMYRHVEALSVTPFAARAVDRGIMGLLVALVRNLNPGLNANETAYKFDRTSATADHVVNEIWRRASVVTGDRRSTAQVADQLNHRLDIWEARRKKPGVRLVYREPHRNTDAHPLLGQPDGGRWQPTTCPTSLREVEPGIRLILDPRRDLGDDEAPPFVPPTNPEAVS